MRDEQYVLNHCTTYLARFNLDGRHSFGEAHFAPADLRKNIRESWRFPIVDTCDTPTLAERAVSNDVTFVYPDFENRINQVSVIGSFAQLHTPIPLNRIKFLEEATAYFAVTVKVPRRGIYFYRFLVDGSPQLDSINPQRERLDNGVEWSRFFTWECSEPILFERWEMAILQRLCNHILPFRSAEAQRFLSSYYDSLDASSRRGLQRHAYRLDDSAGAALFIDHLLAKEESHHAVDYRICLSQMDRILRQRDPFHEPADASRDLYVELYDELKEDRVNGWDVSAYNSPRYFLELLRRHAFTGAFSHPKYGGNAAAAGWAYLDSELYPGRRVFDWSASIEQPLGRSETYLG